MKRIAVLLFGCSSPPAHPTPAVLPAASTACYAGVSTGMGQKARTIARRTIDPAARKIREDVSHDDKGAHGARSFHVVMDVDGDHFTMTELGGAFTGTGTLAGEPWRWTSWSSTSQVANAAGVTVDSDDELTATGMTATKQIRKDGKVIASTSERLDTFDCANWDKAVSELAVPALDEAACERACRNYATLKFWQAADAEIARAPEAGRGAARQKKAADFVPMLEGGLPTCSKQCLAANNAAQTACMGDATTVAALSACDQP